ncbi:hypothetical protein M959_04455, partial [Chaetura pelagica]
VSEGHLDCFKGHTNFILLEVGPHGLSIIYGPDSLADPCH